MIFVHDEPEIVGEKSYPPSNVSEPCNYTTDKENDEPLIEDMESSESCESENGLAIWTIVFLLQLQVTHGISDKAINSVFKFFKTILKLLSDTEKQLSVAKYYQTFPPTLYMALKHVNISSKSFQEFCVCPGCKSV